MLAGKAATRRASRLSRMSISRKSLAGAAWPAPGQKAPPPLACRMARGKMSMSIAKAESAVLDSAAQREVNAAKQEKANADAAEMLAKRSAKCSTPCRKRSACKPRQIANTSKQSGS